MICSKMHGLIAAANGFAGFFAAVLYFYFYRNRTLGMAAA